MEIEMARELLRLYVESDYNAQLHIFAIQHDSIMAGIFSKAFKESCDKLLAEIRRTRNDSTRHQERV